MHILSSRSHNLDEFGVPGTRQDGSLAAALDEAIAAGRQAPSARDTLATWMTWMTWMTMIWTIAPYRFVQQRRDEKR